MSDKQYRQWLADNRDLAALPLRPHYRAYSKRKAHALTGLERLRAVRVVDCRGRGLERLSPGFRPPGCWQRGSSAALCQAAERYLADPGLPGRLSASGRSTWPTGRWRPTPSITCITRSGASKGHGMARPKVSTDAADCPQLIGNRKQAAATRRTSRRFWINDLRIAMLEADVRAEPSFC